MYVGFLTRMRCAPDNCTWLGGHLSGELAYSYDGLAWQRLGQDAADDTAAAATATAAATSATAAATATAATAAAAVPSPPQLRDSPDAVIFPNRPGLTAGQIYATAMQPSRDGNSLYIYASVASVEHGHGVDSETANASCARGGAAPCSHIATFGLRKDGFVGLRQGSPSTPAIVTTVPVVWARRGGGAAGLYVNFAAPGTVAVAVMDGKTGAALAGYSATLTQGGTAVPVFEAGRMAKLAGRQIAFRLAITGGAVVYSVRGGFSAAL